MIRIANILTAIRFLLGPFIMYLIIKSQNDLAFAFFVLGVLTDFLDGLIARKNKEQNNFGEIFDSVSDKIFVLFVLVGLLIKNNLKFLIFAILIFILIYSFGYYVLLRKKVKKNVTGKFLWGVIISIIAFMILTKIVNIYTLGVMFFFTFLHIVNYSVIILRGKK